MFVGLKTVEHIFYCCFRILDVVIQRDVRDDQVVEKREEGGKHGANV